MWLVPFALGCSFEESPRDTTSPETSIPASDATTETMGEAPRRPSSAFVKIRNAAYDLDAQCYSGGMGEIVLTARTPGLSEPRVELYVQAFLAEPYVGISVTADDKTVLHEPNLTILFEILRQGDVFRIDDVSLVTDLDLFTGDAVDAGRSTIVVECTSYVDGLPPGFESG